MRTARCHPEGTALQVLEAGDWKPEVRRWKAKPHFSRTREDIPGDHGNCGGSVAAVSQECALGDGNDSLNREMLNVNSKMPP